MADFYGYSDTSRTTMVAFVLDGGPKVASCVINDKLYNKGMHKLVEFNYLKTILNFIISFLL